MDEYCPASFGRILSDDLGVAYKKYEICGFLSCRRVLSNQYLARTFWDLICLNKK